MWGTSPFVMYGPRPHPRIDPPEFLYWETSARRMLPGPGTRELSAPRRASGPGGTLPRLSVVARAPTPRR